MRPRNRERAMAARALTGASRVRPVESRWTGERGRRGARSVAERARGDDKWRRFSGLGSGWRRSL